jgi:hypothetical protein
MTPMNADKKKGRTNGAFCETGQLEVQVRVLNALFFEGLKNQRGGLLLSLTKGGRIPPWNPPL